MRMQGSLVLDLFIYLIESQEKLHLERTSGGHPPQSKAVFQLR